MTTSSNQPPTGPPNGRREKSDNLVPGIKDGQARGPDGKILRKGQAPLSEDVEDVVTAMQHVYTKAPISDRTHQQRNLRAMKDANPVGFYDRMTALKANSPNPTGREWDGRERRKPWDGVERRAPLEDAGAEKIMALMRELQEESLT